MDDVVHNCAQFSGTVLACEHYFQNEWQQLYKTVGA